MSLLAGLSQQGDSIAAHNSDAAAHGFGVYTVAQLNAFTSANRPTGAVYCSDCLTPEGVGSPVVWNGTKWITTCSGIEATTSNLAYHRALRVSGREVSSAVAFAKYIRPSRNGANYLSTSGGGVIVPGYDLSTLGYQVSTNGGYTSRSVYNFTFTPFLRSSRRPLVASAYYAAEISVSALSTVGDEYWAMFGFLDPSVTNALGSQCVAFALDRANSLALGNTKNSTAFIAVSRAPSSNTPLVTSVECPIDPTAPVLVEIELTNGNANFYAAGTLVHTATTNVPVGQQLEARTAVVKTTGNTARTLFSTDEFFSIRF